MPQLMSGADWLNGKAANNLVNLASNYGQGYSNLANYGRSLNWYSRRTMGLEAWVYHCNACFDWNEV